MNITRKKERNSLKEKSDYSIELDRINYIVMIEILDRHIDQTKEDLPYMAEIDQKREGALFDLVFTIREKLIKKGGGIKIGFIFSFLFAVFSCIIT